MASKQTKDKPKLRKKGGKVVYRFTPPGPRVITAIAKSPAKVASLHTEREIMRQVARGQTYEQISEDMGISTAEAFKIAKETIAKWVSETGLNLLEARELDLKRIDAIMVILWKEIEPGTVIDGETGRPVIPETNLAAIKLLMECINKRGDILGYSAARKMETLEKVEHLHRIYIGADPDDL